VEEQLPVAVGIGRVIGEVDLFGRIATVRQRQHVGGREVVVLEVEWRRHGDPAGSSCSRRVNSPSTPRRLSSRTKSPRTVIEGPHSVVDGVGRLIRVARCVARQISAAARIGCGHAEVLPRAVVIEERQRRVEARRLMRYEKPEVVDLVQHDLAAEDTVEVVRRGQDVGAWPRRGCRPLGERQRDIVLASSRAPDGGTSCVLTNGRAIGRPPRSSRSCREQSRRVDGEHLGTVTAARQLEGPLWTLMEYPRKTSITSESPRNDDFSVIADGRHREGTSVLVAQSVSLATSARCTGSRPAGSRNAFGSCSTRCWPALAADPAAGQTSRR